MDVAYDHFFSSILVLMIMQLPNVIVIVSNEFPDPKNIRINHKIIKFGLIATDFWIFTIAAAILDAILKKTHFASSDFGRHLVCHKVDQMLTESVNKPFVGLFLGSNLILT